jgi:ribosomal protein L12E/L44/L45/RPP1/RPP2
VAGVEANKEALEVLIKSLKGKKIHEVRQKKD